MFALLSIASPVGAQITPQPVLAEAMQQANVREGPGLEYYAIGNIRAGARYRVIGRHEIYPWLLIEFGDPVQHGWVFAEIVNITGDLNLVPFVPLDAAFTSSPTSAPPLESPTPTLTLAPPPADSATPPAPAATMTPPAQGAPAVGAPAEAATGVTVRALNRANVRCGPGIDYLVAGSISSDEVYTVLTRHTAFPWLQIRYPTTQAAWVYAELVEVSGDLSQVPAITGVGSACPVLTPTPPVVMPGVSPWGQTPTGSGPVDMTILGEAILGYLYERDYFPRTERQGSAFGLNLQTGESFSLNPGIAFSGMSLIKVPVLVTYFRYLNAPPNEDQAAWITGMMTCSNNPASNAILRDLGRGDAYAGAERVTATMRELGLNNTFLQGPLVEDPELARHEELTPIRTSVDQQATDPDPYNQTTPDEIGWLLGALYQCGQQESGPLLSRIDGLTPAECRRVLHALDENYLGAMIEAGVPYDTTVAHKHGWTTGDTHGDAGIVFTPGGDYVLVIILHQREWLTYLDAWPNIAELSRLVYNTFNPGAPLAEIHPEEVPETCDISNSPLFGLLMQPDPPPLR
ncbi:MAG: serine hydrolase [Anaerolineae bacterium]|nr:serine hydrolase [Anaerolineae bacterium]